MCPECGKMFEQKWKMKAHIKNVHTFGHFQCQECGKEFTLKQQIKNHIYNHHQAPKQCLYCVKDVKPLSGHIKGVHAPTSEVTHLQFMPKQIGLSFAQHVQGHSKTLTTVKSTSDLYMEIWMKPLLVLLVISAANNLLMKPTYSIIREVLMR